MTINEKKHMEFKIRMPRLKKDLESDVQRRKADLAQRGDVYDEIDQKTEVILDQLCIIILILITLCSYAHYCPVITVFLSFRSSIKNFVCFSKGLTKR